MAPDWDIAVTAEASFDGWLAQVALRRGALEHHYRVRVPDIAWRRMTGGSVPVEELLRATFEFLLAREPPESILGTFEVTVVPKYFPEYEAAMKARFAGR